MKPALIKLLSAPLRGANATGRSLNSGLRYVTKVPEGSKFFSTPGQTAKQLFRLGFNPNLGRVGNWLKRGLWAHSGLTTGMSLSDTFERLEPKARILSHITPDPDVRRVAEMIAHAPLTTLLRSSIGTLTDVDPAVAERGGQILRDEGQQGARELLHSSSKYRARPLAVLKDISSPLKRPVLKVLDHLLPR